MSDWTEEQRAALPTLWAEGLTVAQIADQLRKKRNQVIGVVHRMGLPSRPSPIKRGVPRAARLVRPPRAAAKLNAAASPSPSPKAAASAPVRLPFRAVPRASSCQWPFGDPRDPSFRFCGCREVLPGKPYCAEHATIAYTSVAEGATE